MARDEAVAEAAERDKSRLDRDREAETRIDLLRGNEEHRKMVDAEPPRALEDGDAPSKESRKDSRKRKRLPGEDDTDRDLRHAMERAEGGRDVAVARLRATKPEEADAPITDRRGNINLFPETSKGHRRRRTEEDKEKRRQKEAEENMGMPLKEALGRHGSERTWYLDADGTVKDRQGRDVWGNEDPRRIRRDSQRVASADPLAFMKQAQTRLKEVQRERRLREQEVKALSRPRDAEPEDFSLDRPPVEARRESGHKHRSRHSSSGGGREKRRHDRDRRESRRILEG